MRANERTDERVAQYLHLGSCLIWPTVPYYRRPIVPRSGCQFHRRCRRHHLHRLPRRRAPRPEEGEALRLGLPGEKGTTKICFMFNTRRHLHSLPRLFPTPPTRGKIHRYSTPVLNIISPIKHIIFGPLKYIHSY